MPTPRDSTDELPPLFEPHIHTSCPPDHHDRPAQWSHQVLGDIENALAGAVAGSDLTRPGVLNDGDHGQILDPWPGGAENRSSRDDSLCKSSNENAASPTDAFLAEGAAEQDALEGHGSESQDSALHLALSDRHGILSSRLIQSYTSCKLRAGSRYRGTQTSDQQQYNVEVVVKTVDMAESFICGYLKIEGLTPEHATLTTYFEGEIIGPRYTFQTRHDSWGASGKDDLKHWAHFSAWKPLAKQAKKADFHYKHTENREHIFMRWKEKFLVPDHKVKEISGASFEGFYYICFNQVEGAISGIYYHSKSDQHHNNKIQNLELKWVPDNGCFAAIEFR